MLPIVKILSLLPSQISLRQLGDLHQSTQQPDLLRVIPVHRNHNPGALA
jgi:hypothetical protein